jgi:RND family efflux transporter MFP subunit
MTARSRFVWLWYLVLTLLVAPEALAEEPRSRVGVVKPVLRQVTDFEDFTGRVAAIEHVELRARVTGYLIRADFEEGALVKKGDLLFEIDPRPYKVDLDRALALVAQAEARLKSAQIGVKRATQLVQQRVIGQDEHDKIAGERIEAEAAVRVAQAGLAAAQLNLELTRITAPINGRIGRRILDPGNLVKADDTVLATIVSQDPLCVYFEVDERTALRLFEKGREGLRPEKKPPVLLGLADQTGFPRRGVLDFVDNQLDPRTGTLRLRAVLPNPDGVLKPGLFARVRLPLGEPYQALLVPERATGTDGLGTRKFVYVVDDKNAVHYRVVKLGTKHDGLVVVTEGLKPDEMVIGSGLQRIRPGSTVEPTPMPAIPEMPPAKP